MRARFFGQYLIAHGLVTSPQLLAAIEYQDRSNSKVGNCAVTLGLATPFEVEQVRALQAREDLRFGDAALRLGVLSDDEVERAIAARESAHIQLGEALVALGYLSPAQVEAAAAQFIAAEARLEPEVVTVPDDLPLRDVAFELFHLAHKLLLRVCDLTSKTERLRVIRDVLPLSDRNARVVLAGAIDSSVLLCVPHAIATDVASRFSGEVAPDEASVDGIVSELANLLCGNLQSVLAEQGIRVQVSEPERVAVRVSMPPGSAVALVPFVTHRGQVLVGLGLPHGS
jgi:CheY-specific phosphatase CheX